MNVQCSKLSRINYHIIMCFLDGIMYFGQVIAIFQNLATACNCDLVSIMLLQMTTSNLWFLCGLATNASWTNTGPLLSGWGPLDSLYLNFCLKCM